MWWSSTSSWTSLSSSRNLRAGTTARSSRFSVSSSRLAGRAGRDGDAGYNPDLVVDQSGDEAAAAAGAGAAGGWQGWVDGAVAKVKEALPEPGEAKKILPLGLMLFFILFDYTILRDTKVQTTCYLYNSAPRSGFACLSGCLAPHQLACPWVVMCGFLLCLFWQSGEGVVAAEKSRPFFLFRVLLPNPEINSV